MKNQFRLTKRTLRKIIFAMLFFTGLCNTSIYAQTKTIIGVITDEAGSPLPGANIFEKGTKNGTTSDFDGNYSVVINQGSTLTFSFMGYRTVDIVIGEQTTLNVKLEPDFNQLEEAVVIGYGSVRRKDVTGSVASVKVDELQRAPVANFDQALAGRVTGVQVSASSGEPGEGLNVLIRGGNTINGDNSPLYVLDGFIIDDFNPGIIDPSDIQSIDVLKDASATAIYGARGANGVVLITTKQSKLGKTIVSYEKRIDIKNVSKTIDVLDAYEFIKYGLELNPAQTSSKYFEDADGNVVGGLEDYRNEPTANWQDEAFRTANSISHKLRISNGTDKTKFNASLNYLDDEGTLINTGYKKINGRLNLKHNINKKIDLTMDLIYSNSEQFGLDTQGTSSYSFMRNLISYVPVANKFIDYGDANPLYGITDEFYDDAIFNWHPILSLENEYRKREEDQFISNIAMRFKITPYLTFSTKGSYNKKFRQNGVFNNSKTVYGRLVNPINGINGSMDYTTWVTLSNINTLTFNKRLGENHHLNAMVGFSVNAKNVNRNLIRAIQIPQYAESQGINALDEGDLGTTNDFAGSYNERIQSVLARVNYSFKDRYLLTSSIRRDGSSKFAENHNIGYMPSVALSWKAEEEDFIKNIDVISQLKLKVGYGKTGNDRFKFI